MPWKVIATTTLACIVYANCLADALSQERVDRLNFWPRKYNQTETIYLEGSNLYKFGLGTFNLSAKMYCEYDNLELQLSVYFDGVDSIRREVSSDIIDVLIAITRDAALSEIVSIPVGKEDVIKGASLIRTEGTFIQKHSMYRVEGFNGIWIKLHLERLDLETLQNGGQLAVFMKWQNGSYLFGGSQPHWDKIGLGSPRIDAGTLEKYLGQCI